MYGETVSQLDILHQLNESDGPERTLNLSTGSGSNTKTVSSEMETEIKSTSIIGENVSRVTLEIF